MHILLTDLLVCPECGEDFGLVLLAESVVDRRILEGDLGCPNCRATYPVREGFGDLRSAPRPPFPDKTVGEGAVPTDPEDTIRLAALLGVAEGPGALLVRGPSAKHAGALARLIGQVEVVGVDPSLRDEPESPQVSRLTSAGKMPFRSGAFLGVLLSGGMAGPDLWEGARVTAPKGRLVVLDAPEEAGREAEKLGLSVVLEEEGVLVARRTGPQPQPLVTLRGL